MKKRPGNLRSYGFGAFGKGSFVPPPTMPSKPGEYLGGKWTCDQATKPAGQGDDYYQCCPSGWVKTKYGDTNPCASESGVYNCGPLPQGADASNAVCCPNSNQWTPKGAAGDPCAPVPQQQILAPDVDTSAASEGLITPGLLAAGGAAIVLLIIITVMVKKR